MTFFCSFVTILLNRQKSGLKSLPVKQQLAAGIFFNDTPYLVNGNYLDVVELLKDNSIFEKVKPYLYYEYVYDSSAYRLVTSDDKILGIHLPNDPNDTSDRHAWYSEWEDYGFWDTEYGDKEVVYSNADYYDWDYIWFDGEKATYSNGDVRYYEEYQCFSIWEF